MWQCKRNDGDISEVSFYFGGADPVNRRTHAGCSPRHPVETPGFPGRLGQVSWLTD